MISDALINPFNVDPKHDLPHPIRNIPGWSEHYMGLGYDPAADIGYFIHIGRQPFDPEIWRACLLIYLPNRELLVAKYQGRDGTPRGPGAGPLRMSCIKPFHLWTVEFDGVARAVTQAENAREVVRDGVVEPVKLNVVMKGAGPVWDINQMVMEKQSWAHQHWDQLMTIHGEIALRGKVIALSGSGIRDHSPGPRDYGPVVSDFWINGQFPSGKIFGTTRVRSENLAAEVQSAYIFRGDGSPIELVEILEAPHINALDTPDRSIASDLMEDASLRSFQIVFQSKKGREVIRGELLHTGATTYIAPNEESIGTDFSRPNACQLQTCIARFEWDGEVGWGVRERIARIKTLR